MTGHATGTAPRLPAKVRAWLEQPALQRLWDAAHRRLQRNGRSPSGRLRLPEPADPEREALSLLLGRQFTSRDVIVDLADLDAKLRASAAGCGLVEVVTALRGEIVDRRGQRHARAAAWEAAWSAVEEALESAGLAASAWTGKWLNEVRSGGSVSRLGPERAAELLQQAVVVLAELLPAGGRVRTRQWGRGELAERFTGTAHGLDDDTVLARLVLRGLAHSDGQDTPADPRARRELWEAAGVWPDTLSTTVLTYALTPQDDGWFAGQLRERAAHHAETHLTVRDLRRIRWALRPGTTVFVCENPRVVEAAADARCQQPMVCTSGNPTHTVLALVDALTDAGAAFAYRGDFDWPGVAMANRMITRYGARPWRMRATDYEQQVEQAWSRGTPLQPLSGDPVAAAWDPELTAAMRTIGVAVHEESALELLLNDLSA